MRRKAKDCPVPIQWTPENVRDLLVACARRIRPDLKGLDNVPAKQVVKHGRRYTVRLSPQNIRDGEASDCFRCMWALALDEYPSVLASLIQRRVACTLEHDERGNLHVYRYGVPDMARFTAVKHDNPKFDRSKLKEMAVVFRELPFSRTAKGVKLGKGTGKTRGPNKKRKVNKFANLRKSVHRDLLREAGVQLAA